MESRNHLQSFRATIASHKFLSGMACLIVIGLIGFFIFQQYQDYTYANRVTFQEYTPTWLPSDVRVTGREINIDHSSHYKTTDIIFNLILNHPSSSYIQESQVAQKKDSCTYYSNTGQACQVITTPHGQKYILLLNNIAHMSTDNQGIELYKGNVNIYMRLSGYAGQPYSKAILNQIVDSFTTVHYRLVHGTTSEDCGCGG